MKHNWEYKQWNDVLKIFNGKNQKAVENPNGLYPIYGSGGIMSYADDYICPENCTIIGRKGNINNPIFVPTKFWNVDTAFGLYPSDFLHPRYLYYFCKIYDFEKHNKATTIPSLVKNDLLNISMPVPPMETQEQIVAELDQINDLIAKNRELLSQLNALAQSLFYDTFGDPITNPKGWKLQQLKDLVVGKLTYGSGASGIPFDNCIRYIRITDIDDTGRLKPEIASSPSNYDSKYDLVDGDILFARSGATVGKSFLYKDYIGKAIYAGYLIRARVNNEFILPIYLYTVSKTRYYIDYITSSIRGAAQPNVNAQLYGAFVIPVPPLSLQEEFAAKAEAIEAQKAKVEAEIAELQTLLDARMDYWFN